MTQAHFLERWENVVELSIRNAYPGYRLSGALTLDAAYTGGTAMFDVRGGTHFRSPGLVRSGRNRVSEPNRGLTRIGYDPNEYVSATLPGDAQVAFLRVTDLDAAGNALSQGPILVVPPAGFFAGGRINLALNGTAPDVAALASNIAPQTAMWVDLPKYATSITVRNKETAGGDSVFVSMAPGTQEIEIPAASELEFKKSGATMISFRGQGGTVSFDVRAVLVNGIDA